MVFLWQHLHCATKHKISLIYNHLSPYGICSVHYSNIHSYGPRLHMARNEWPPSFPWTPLNKITIGPSIPLTFSLPVDRRDHCSDACKTRGSMCPGLPRCGSDFSKLLPSSHLASGFACFAGSLVL